jgi:hypothetical protein
MYLVDGSKLRGQFLREETMREVHEQLDTILEEAIDNNFDQLVVVSRSD